MFAKEYIKKVAKMFDFDSFLSEDECKGILSRYVTQGVRVGHWDSIPLEAFCEMTDTYCSRIDLAMEDEEDRNKGYTNRWGELAENRGCTFSEFQDVYDAEIDGEEYVEFPAFFMLDIQTPSERKRFIRDNPFSPETYMYVLKKYKPLLFKYLTPKENEIQIPASEFWMNAHILGAIGAGKSGFMEHIWYDIQSHLPYSQIFLDWHGTTAKHIFSFDLNEAQKERVIYIDPTLRTDYFPCINPLKCTDKSRRTVAFAADQLVMTFKEIFGDASEVLNV